MATELGFDSVQDHRMGKLAIRTCNFAVLRIGLHVDLHTFGVGLAKEGELPALAIAAAKLQRIERNAQLHSVFAGAARSLGLKFDVIRNVHLVVRMVGGVVFAHVELNSVGVGAQEDHVARVAVNVQGDSDKVVFPSGVAAVEVGPKVAGVDAAAKGHVQGLIVFEDEAFGGQRSGCVVARINLPAQGQA